MTPISNQGYRKDLNLSEGTDDSSIWSNLYSAGLANDLAILRNNLRNTSHLGISSMTLDTSEVGVASYFSFQKSDTPPYNTGEPRDAVFTNDDVVGFSHTVTFGTGGGATSVVGGSSPNYYVCSSNGRNQFKISTTASVSGVSTLSINSYPPVIINGRAWAASGSIIGFVHDGREDTGRSGSTWSNRMPSGGSGTGAYFTVSNQGATVEFANDSTNPTGKAIGSNYRVGDELVLSAVGGKGDITITITDVQDFRIVRKDPINKYNFTNFIPPEVQADSGFDWLDGGTINGAFEVISSNADTAEYFIAQKFKSTGNTITTKDIKLEGSSLIGDPGNSNISQANVNASDSPGVFIGNTRAFSSDNNPWTKEGTAGASGASLKTLSYESTIGELSFLDDIEITGISRQTVSSSTLGSYAPGTKDLWKIPAVINGETYFLLLDQAT